MIIASGVSDCPKADGRIRNTLNTNSVIMISVVRLTTFLPFGFRDSIFLELWVSRSASVPRTHRVAVRYVLRRP